MLVVSAHLDFFSVYYANKTDHSYAEFTGTMVVGCMPMFPRFYEHFTGSCMRSRSTRDTALSRTAEENMSTRQIVVTSEFTREDVQDDLNFIELTAGFGKISR